MSFQIGDTVIHWNYGLGRIALIEERILRGRPTECYVFKTPDLTIWIPIDSTDPTSLRNPTPADGFEPLFTILSSPGDPLPTDRMLRKDHLRSQMKGGQLESICRVIRDLEFFKRSAKLNDQETAILEQAKRSLLTEWTYSLGVTSAQAEQALLGLLGNPTAPHAGGSSSGQRTKKTNTTELPAL